MTFWWRNTVVLLAGLFLAGCDFFPSAERQLDEQKEPWFKVGMTRQKSMDYQGAISAFKKAIESNPRSASAHFYLALLYEKQETEYAAAIYHFERFLELRPDSPFAEVAKPHIVRCKQELAKSVSLPPLLQGEIQRLTSENAYLRQQLEIWQNQQGTKTNSFSFPPATNRWGNQITIRSNPPTGIRPSGPPTPATQNVARPRQQPQPQAPTMRKHTVRTGETIARIARNHGISEQLLLSANPGVRPKYLKAGMILQIPSR